MGNSQSTTAAATKHVFSAATPINFSPNLISSLESTPETNSSRARSIDLHIQQRVAEELARIQKLENSKLEAARKRIAEEADKDKGGEEKKQSTGEQKLSEEEQRKAASSKKVAAEIEKLKSQLSQRKVLKELPEDVEKARGDVVSCLRVNDRRPLDCWKEVEVFKRAVKGLEDEFVRKVL